jgi:hypothetical protein
VYQKAVKHAEFLLSMECDRKPCTFNHYFNSTLQEKRIQRLVGPLEKSAVTLEGVAGKHVPVAKLQTCVTNQSNTQQACEDILDTLVSYYKVSRKRFIDGLCQQVVFHFLLEADDSPLNILNPELIMGLDADQLEAIAGEDEVSKQTRQSLEREVQNLEAALKVLRC